MVAKPPGAGYTRHLYTAKWTPAACKYWNHWRPLELQSFSPNSSSLVVFHSYRWSYPIPWLLSTPKPLFTSLISNTWPSQHMDQHWVLQDWMQRALYFQWFDLCCTSPWRSTGSPTSQNIWNYQRWQASCVSLSLLPIRSQITCTRDYKRVQTNILLLDQFRSLLVTCICHYWFMDFSKLLHGSVKAAKRID